MLTLVLAESALETVPKELQFHPAVARHAKKRGKSSEFIVLDRSYHHAAMKALKDNQRRGRPDIIHFSMLEALGSPLNKEKLLRLYVHTLHDYVISVNPETRLPRNYSRFIGLMEQLFEFGRIPPRGEALMVLEQKSMRELADAVKPSYVVAFSRAGRPMTMEEAVSRLSDEENPLAVIGGFPAGRFTEATTKLAKDIVSIDRDMLEAWTVTSRLIYEYERAVSLPRSRIS